MGINFMKMYARYSTVEGLGFAIPSVQAERVVNDLLAYGALQPEPVLGVSVRQIPTQLTDTLWGLEVWADAGNAAVTPAARQTGPEFRPGTTFWRWTGRRPSAAATC